MSYPSNRIAALLKGCPDPGGILFLPAPSGSASYAVPAPKADHLDLPAGGLSAHEFARLLGLPTFLVVRELIGLGLFLSATAPLDLCTATQLCSRLGVSVTHLLDCPRSGSLCILSSLSLIP